MNDLQPRFRDDGSALRAMRWFTITHGLSMAGFVLIVALFLGYAYWTGGDHPTSVSIEQTLQRAVVGLSAAIFAILLLLGRHAQRRLAAELERDRLFELSPDPLCVLDLDGSLIRGNPAFDGFFAPEYGRANNIMARAHPDDLHDVRAAFRSIARSGANSVSFEARFKPAVDPARSADTPNEAIGASPPEMGWRWLQWSVRCDRHAHPVRLYAITRDTTQRRETEAALAAETAFRRAMEDSMLTGMRAFDLDGRITYVNRAFCTMSGYTEQELVGATPPFPYWLPGQEAIQQAHLDRTLAGGAPPSGIETRLRRRDGVVLDVKMYVSPLIDVEGRHTGWMTSMTDITEPRRIREALAAAHERFTTVLEERDAAVSVVAVTDAAQGPPPLLFANRMYRQLFGATGHGHAALIKSSVDGGGYETFHNGLGRWFELRARHIRWVDASLVQMLVATDITARREADERVRSQELRLQHNARLVTMGEMASSLAHELNQPLTAISNYCMGLAARLRITLAQGRSVQPNELIEPLRKTAAQAERAGEVIRRIRNFVKRSQAERVQCNPADIATEALGLASIDAKRHRVRIQTDVASDLPALLADPILLQQVLLNLLKNAIEASRETPAGNARTVTLRARVDGAMLEFAVTDRGPGIAEEVRARLFEPFFTTKPEGMGIGLNICRSIVESHQGRLWAERAEEGGTCFRFIVPLAEPALARAA